MENLPVHKHTVTSIETALNEGARLWEMHEQVFVIDVVHFDLEVSEGIKHALVQGHANDGKDMGDVRLLQGLLST